jgi:hypothetical protein
METQDPSIIMKQNEKQQKILENTSSESLNEELIAEENEEEEIYSHLRLK